MEYDYVKVILYAYPHLAALAEAVGIGAENKAYLSFRGGESALALAEKIAEELAVKSRLLALLEDAEVAVGACSREERFLLEYKYFRRKRVLREAYAGMTMACSERHYFRRQAALLRKMASQFCLRGWTEAAFLRAFGSFSPFLRALAALSAGREKALVPHRSKREIAFRIQKSEECEAGRLPRRTSTAITTVAAQMRQMTTMGTTLSEGDSSGAGAVVSPPSPASAAR